ncbi:hypothetical protein HanIR_Chr10g0469201 [Helianthus annuus]|nr:hypothetical protein HanIR_Chr10g0469201 [Helianthus annuus]
MRNLLWSYPMISSSSRWKTIYGDGDVNQQMEERRWWWPANLCYHLIYILIRSFYQVFGLNNKTTKENVTNI